MMSDGHQIDRWISTKPASPAPVAVPRVLVIDDDCEILELVARILGAEGLTVRTAENGLEAIDLAQGEPAISLAILDWQLPGMGGEQILDRLTAIRPGIRAIVATGGRAGDVQRAFSGRRVDYFLAKPFDVGRLVAAVKSALAV